MAEPTLKRTSVQIKYTSSEGYRSEFSCKAGDGAKNIKTGEGIPAQHALISAIEELARLTALFGFEPEARAAVDGAFARVAEWRTQRVSCPKGGAA